MMAETGNTSSKICGFFGCCIAEIMERTGLAREVAVAVVVYLLK